MQQILIGFKEIDEQTMTKKGRKTWWFQSYKCKKNYKICILERTMWGKMMKSNKQTIKRKKMTKMRFTKLQQLKVWPKSTKSSKPGRYYAMVNIW